MELRVNADCIGDRNGWEGRKVGCDQLAYVGEEKRVGAEDLSRTLALHYERSREVSPSSYGAREGI